MSNLNQFIRLPAVIRITSLSRSSVYARLDSSSASYDPAFPRPVKLSPGPKGAVAWLESEVNAWQQLKIAERDSDN
jgi:predicted DNA-binding transcriptional regulator AlpA